MTLFLCFWLSETIAMEFKSILVQICRLCLLFYFLQEKIFGNDTTFNDNSLIKVILTDVFVNCDC